MLWVSKLLGSQPNATWRHWSEDVGPCSEPFASARSGYIIISSGQLTRFLILGANNTLLIEVIMLMQVYGVRLTHVASIVGLPDI